MLPCTTYLSPRLHTALSEGRYFSCRIMTSRLHHRFRCSCVPHLHVRSPAVRPGCSSSMIPYTIPETRASHTHPRRHAPQISTPQALPLPWSVEVATALRCRGFPEH